MDIEIGDDTFTKKPNVLEEIAYRDTWGKGADSFISMIYERLILMRELLAKDGSIYVHCDWRLTAPLREIIEEIFGTDKYRNEIIWKRRRRADPQNNMGVAVDTIHFASKSDQFTINHQYTRDSEEAKKYIQERFVKRHSTGESTWWLPLKETLPSESVKTSSMSTKAIHRVLAG